jgi:aryl-alcohol dehydrogenase-like predicted oxidoreductase
MISATSIQNSKVSATFSISLRYELEKLAHERFGKSVLALALRWVLDQGPTIALWGARNPSQLGPIGDVEGWHIDSATEAEIDAVLKRCIVDPVSPAFMAPPVTRPKQQEAA